MCDLVKRAKDACVMSPDEARALAAKRQERGPRMSIPAELIMVLHAELGDVLVNREKAVDRDTLRKSGDKVVVCGSPEYLQMVYCCILFISLTGLYARVTALFRKGKRHRT